MTETTQTPARFAKALLIRCRGASKRDRTRARLQAAMAELLDDRPPADLKVADICRVAGSAHGTFYTYFPDIRGALADTLLEFITFLQGEMRQAARNGPTPEDRSRRSTAAYLDLFAANRGLMRCLVTRLDAFPEASAAFQRLNRDWAETVADAWGRRGATSRDELLRRAYALGGMVDQYLIMLHFGDDPTLAALSQDRTALIETLSHIWERGMTG
ncbi:TetR/AcrR family transcriptional regulator [Nioella nitratireducens]|uniref:TetR/AcrR family transcriptional regulator n=1 Tax=Nioella nitratireducens TaxID=1287720 RepID=UPI000A00CE86|nr:TetR/AcrR family transcriptional regulator [Nioella nitratireducens]